MKKGVFFTIDAILAILLIAIGIVLVSGFYMFNPPSQRMDYVSYDTLQVLGEMKVVESKNPFVQTLYANGTITRGNNSILEQIGEFWADGDIPHATELAQNVMQGVWENGTDWALSVGGDLIYTTSPVYSDNMWNAQRMVSGMEKLKPTFGYTARATLTRVKQRVVYGYGYFGGFVGQGNISAPVRLAGNITYVSEIYVETAAASNFTLYINGNKSGKFILGSGGGNFSIRKPDGWILHPGNHSFIKNGTNRVDIRFSGIGYDKQYVAGGLVRVKYTTASNDEVLMEFVGPSKARERYYFPGIFGAINLFDAFYVPGTIDNMSIRLHYFTNHSHHNNTIIFSVANYPLLFDNDSVVPQNITFNNSYLRSIFGGYEPFNDTSVPLRFGFANITGNTGLVDVALVTDRSGSMAFAGWRLINATRPQQRILNVNVPQNGWSNTYTFTLPTTGQRQLGYMFEAESYNQRINRSSHYWERYTTWGGYTGTGYMRAMPNNGASINANYAATSPELRFSVNFDEAGTYYVWIRGRAQTGSDDTLHAGIDGTTPSSVVQ
jgi:hypothetical protein